MSSARTSPRGPPLTWGARSGRSAAPHRPSSRWSSARPSGGFLDQPANGREVKMRRYRQPGPGGMLQDANDVTLIVVLGLIAVVAIGTWLTGQVAALCFHGDWPSVSVGQALAAAWRLP